LKALSVVSASPGQLLQHLATYHGHRSGDKDQLLTLVLAVIDPKTRKLTWASAGHIPPFLVQPATNSAVPLDDAQGLPLGLGVVWRESSRQMADGELLMLASDGLVEDRRRSLDVGLSDLERALAALEVTSAAQVCDQIVGHMVGDRARDDDVTVLCLRIDARITAAGWALPANPESVPRARGLVAAELTRFGIEDPEVFETVKLLTSELVTNAVRHSFDDIMLCLDRIDRLLRVTVLDTNADLRLEPKPAEVEGQRGRGLLLVEALATDWGVTPQAPGKQVWFELEIDR
jgi:anti-sigma regulatory factor (Ser/Thr protein kinase)